MTTPLLMDALFLIGLFQLLRTLTELMDQTLLPRPDSAPLLHFLGWLSELLGTATYGAAVGLLVSMMGRCLLSSTKFVRSVATAAAAVLGAVALSVVSGLAPSLLPYLAVAILFCMLLAVLGLATSWTRFLLVPVAVVLAWGVQVGCQRMDLAWLRMVHPLITAVLLTGAVQLASANEFVLGKALAGFLLALGMVLIEPYVIDDKVFPRMEILACVWFLAWGALAVALRGSVSPSFRPMAGTS